MNFYFKTDSNRTANTPRFRGGQGPKTQPKQPKTEPGRIEVGSRFDESKQRAYMDIGDWVQVIKYDMRVAEPTRATCIFVFILISYIVVIFIQCRFSIEFEQNSSVSHVHSFSFSL
jgi:hypothetical protein